MEPITIHTIVHTDARKVWSLWTSPEAIQQWNHASDDWECPSAENDVVVGGKFSIRMAAKDGSTSFDFRGVYTEVVPLERLAYTMSDGRKVLVMFEKLSDTETKIVETFDPEMLNSPEMQRAGWQAILDTFRSYVEAH